MNVRASPSASVALSVTATAVSSADVKLCAAAVLGLAFAVSYAAAVFVNAARITIAMFMAAHPIALSALTAADVHRIEGIVVYFGGLALLYEGVHRLDRHVRPVRYQP